MSLPSSSRVLPVVGLVGFVGLATLATACRGSGEHADAAPHAAVSLSANAPPPPAVAADAALAAVEAGAPVTDGGTLGSADRVVIVLSIDSLRADMPWNGYPRPIAPHLTELEKRSVSYTHAYAISSYTSMSLGGLLGGRYPSELKRSGFFFGSYAKDNLFFPELLKQKGVRNVGAQAHGYFNSAGFDQGFDVWQIVPGIVFKNETDPNVTSPQHEAMAEKILGDAALETGRFFAWFHFLDPHDQYLSHEKDGIPAYGKSLRDRYDAEVTFTDRWLGKLLDFIETRSWAKRAVIIVTADHGEAFGEHNQYNHGFELWENLVRVPMFFVVPGATPRRVDVARSAIDLAPTILDLLGASAEPSYEGKSLVPELFGAPAEARDVILDLPMTSDNDKRRALVHDHFKIIAFGKDELLKLFDLAQDPDEKSPILRGADFDAMAARFRAASKAIPEVAPTSCNVGCLNRAYATKK